MSAPYLHAFAVFEYGLQNTIEANSTDQIRCLDIGTGTGVLIAMFDVATTALFGRERRREIIGTEVNDDLVNLARANLHRFYSQHEASRSPSLRWSVERRDYDTFEAESMDFIHIGALLEPHQLANVVKLLKPGGVLLTPRAT
ncbi:MAG: hypothetical protein MHM6MM_002355 [Cercozoa sp. M6MM]